MSDTVTGREEKPNEPRRRAKADIAAELRLRPDPPRVMRLSRKAIATLATVGGLGLGAILIVALQDRAANDGAPELLSTERVQQAEDLTQLPRDYGEVPRLGPPLPGELGRPVLSAQCRSEPVPPLTTPAAPAVDPAEQLRLQEEEAARQSRLFAEANTAVAAAAPSNALPAAGAPGLTGLFPAAAASTTPPDAIDRREAFLSREVDRRTTAADRLQAPPSPYVLQAGSVIEAALITGLRSDLPGQISA
jgi:type IV secretion system protein VirB10